MTTLSGILCDNGDDIDKVTMDVFKRPEKDEDYISCRDILRPSFNAWFG